MTATPTVPRLLLVEDDPVSRLFLAEALAALPATVVTAASIAQARACAERDRVDLWLVDAHLPDGGGVDCLEALRAHAGDTPALAISAELRREDLDRLCAAGFLEVLAKPIAIAALQAAVRRALGMDAAVVTDEPPGSKLPVWDEARALAAVGGRREALQQLKRLFLDELPATRRQVHEACHRGDAGTVQAQLHRLKASCNFVGASRLLAAARSLAEAPLDRARLHRLEAAMDDALQDHGT